MKYLILQIVEAEIDPGISLPFKPPALPSSSSICKALALFAMSSLSISLKSSSFKLAVLGATLCLVLVSYLISTIKIIHLKKGAYFFKLLEMA